MSNVNPDYTPHDWQPREQVHPADLNRIEMGIWSATQRLNAGETGTPIVGGDVGVTYARSAASSWVLPIPVGINRMPGVTLYDTAGNEIGADWHVDLDARTVTVTFPAPFAGSATLN